MGMLPLKPDVADGTVQEKLGIWGLNKEESAAFLASYNKFDFGTYERILIAPIFKASFEPHVILVYGNPAQIWLLVTSYLFPQKKFSLDASISIGAGCISYIAKTMTTDEPQFGLVGLGERYNNAQDYECALSIPAGKIENVVKGMEFAHQMGAFRYPIPGYLKYDAEHPPGYDKMLEHLMA